MYPKIKAADPNAQVLVGGLLLDCDPTDPPAGKTCTSSKFLEGILVNNGGAYFDGVSFRAYNYFYAAAGRYGNLNWHSDWNTTGPVTIAKANYLQNLLSQYGHSDTFMINTENAILCDTCEDNADFEDTKAYYVAQAYTTAMAENLRANIWFSALGWRNSGLLASDLTPLPAYTAYAFARQTLQKDAFVRKINDYANIFGYAFDRGEQNIWVL
ncbi:MAG: hypothetical protein KJ638_04405 [Chloroflexi bacterium]|nr:hypothetical protein [Chloroflexota bacterium]